ncbi:MAG: riboflavin biosynthesis protein RibF [Eggerthellaceae bacterium]|nr:riboflavin biosynthesis protein RibF [Eggerthellaceae bacterium]
MAKLFFCQDIAQLRDYALELSGAVACLGVFDGLHRGHAYLIEQMLSHAEMEHAGSLIITFDIDPDELFRPDALKKLSDNASRIDALMDTSADAVLVLPFTREFAALSPEAFLAVCLEPLSLTGLHVGSDFRYGAKAMGTTCQLEEWGSAHGVTVISHKLLDADGVPITSTRIRCALAEGDIVTANELLGHAYSVSGRVLKGRGEGAKMGIQTANLEVPDNCLAIAEGVYGARACIRDEVFKAAVSVGVSPMFEDVATANLEAHILDFSGDLYGETITVSFLAWLRPMMRFESTEALVSTVKSNIEWVREHC